MGVSINLFACYISVEKWKFDLTPVHLCNLQYPEVKNRLSWKSGCSLACTR